jgi:hypothetical protein
MEVRIRRLKILANVSDNANCVKSETKNKENYVPKLRRIALHHRTSSPWLHPANARMSLELLWNRVKGSVSYQLSVEFAPPNSLNWRGEIIREKAALARSALGSRMNSG